MKNPSSARLAEMKRRNSSAKLEHIPYILAVLVILYIIWLVAMTKAVEASWLQGNPVIVQYGLLRSEKRPEPVLSPTVEVKQPVTGVKGLKMRVTAFSDHECGSHWCNRHEPKVNQVALNYSKYGRHDKVYIPAFDKTYVVVGNTDGKTDLDIWHGDDYEAAVEFGTKELLVNIL